MILECILVWKSFLTMITIFTEYSRVEFFEIFEISKEHKWFVKFFTEIFWQQFTYLWMNERPQLSQIKSLWSLCMLRWWFYRCCLAAKAKRKISNCSRSSKKTILTKSLPLPQSAHFQGFTFSWTDFMWFCKFALRQFVL